MSIELAVAATGLALLRFRVHVGSFLGVCVLQVKVFVMVVIVFE